MIKEIHQKLINKEISAVELARQYLGKIKKTDGEIGAFLNVTEKLALSQAEDTDKKIAMNEEIGLLEGIPCAMKDNMLVEGEKCTAASKILENYTASYDATVIKKIKKQGAVILGKTNMDEFAMGSSTESSAFQKTKNPHDLERVPGGSSGGSAAAVASEQCVFALGSDTGGSIRQPAAFCGVVGIKPTYGSVSRYGLIAMASSLDQIGPLANSVEDAEIVFEAIKGRDILDSTTVESKNLNVPMSALPNRDPDPKASGLKIGIPKECFGEGLDPRIKDAVMTSVSKLEKDGYEIMEVSMSHLEYALAVYYIIMPSEVSTNLARFDGIRYGYSSEEAKDLLDVYSRSKAEGFGTETRRRIILGTYALSSGYYDAYYKRAQKVKTKIIEDFKKVFEKVDVLITPTSPIPPFKFGEKTKDPLSMYLSDVYTVPANISGAPSLSLNCGFIEEGGKRLPVGLQVTGKWFGEESLFYIAREIERGVDNKL